MNISITASPLFYLNVTRPMVDVLLKLSANHYDAICRSCSVRAGDGRVNGVLRTWEMYLEMAEEVTKAEAQVRATFRDLDTLLKCMEIRAGLSPLEHEVVAALSRDIHGALQLANAKNAEWTAEYVSSHS